MYKFLSISGRESSVQRALSRAFFEKCAQNVQNETWKDSRSPCCSFVVRSLDVHSSTILFTACTHPANERATIKYDMCYVEKSVSALDIYFRTLDEAASPSFSLIFQQSRVPFIRTQCCDTSQLVRHKSTPS